MKLQQCIFVCVILTFTILAAGCAKPPTEEMDSAAEAVTRAENDNDAVTYAPNSIARAKDALARMNTEAASKRYDAAKSFAAEAVAAAERAITEGRSGAARARDEASAILTGLNPLITETEQGINAARSAGLPLDFDSVDQDFTTARGNAEQAQAAFSGNQYQDATNRGRQAREGLNRINQQLSTTALATSRKK